MWRWWESEAFFFRYRFAMHESVANTITDTQQVLHGYLADKCYTSVRGREKISRKISAEKEKSVDRTEAKALAGRKVALAISPELRRRFLCSTVTSTVRCDTGK